MHKEKKTKSYTIEFNHDPTDLASESGKFLSNIMPNKPMGVAIIGNAYLENLLSKYLKARLVEYGRGFDIIDSLTCENKIILCHMLGLIDEKTRSDLMTLNHIRNKFAHRVDIDSFEVKNDNVEVPSLINSLNYIKWLSKESKCKIPPNNRLKYLCAAYFYFDHLIQKIKKCKRTKIPIIQYYKIATISDNGNGVFNINFIKEK